MMKEEIIDFVQKKSLDPFSDMRSRVSREGVSIFKTTDSKSIFNRVMSKLSKNFVFDETENIWNLFSFCEDFSLVKARQDFFKSIEPGDNSYLKGISKPRKNWTPEYEIVVVTEDESTFFELQKLNCPVQLIVGENDLSDLERYDLVQVIDCETFSSVLEGLTQSVFIDDLSGVYLERHLEELSGWRDNIKLLSDYSSSPDIQGVVDHLRPLLGLIESGPRERLTIDKAENVLEKVNDSVNEKIKDMTLSGDSLVKMLNENKTPDVLEEIIHQEIDKSGLPRDIFMVKVPVELDYSELEGYIQRQNANEFTSVALEIKRNSEKIKSVSYYLERLKAFLLYEDFCLGVSLYLKSHLDYPILSENVHFEGIVNYFLEDAQPIDFQLDHFNRCSILTGANSGGKTTLLEHFVQCISFFHLGLPVKGRVHLPLFLEVYYFAKNKGSASKGAFENLLTQMSKIRPGSGTLVLADEIEAVTEPGIAGKIISATCDFFIKKNCFLVVATHLGHEVKESLPSGARIDGIEAKGLDRNYELIVDHNPVMGRIAHSTPELIVERMANQKNEEYFVFLRDFLKKDESF